MLHLNGRDHIDSIDCIHSIDSIHPVDSELFPQCLLLIPRNKLISRGLESIVQHGALVLGQRLIRSLLCQNRLDSRIRSIGSSSSDRRGNGNPGGSSVAAAAAVPCIRCIHCIRWIDIECGCIGQFDGRRGIGMGQIDQIQMRHHNHRGVGHRGMDDVLH